MFRFGSWVQARIEEQVERPRSKAKKRDTELVPKYGVKQIEAFIYGPLPDPAAKQRGEDGVALSWANVDPYSVEADDTPPTHRKYSGQGMPDIPMKA